MKVLIINHCAHNKGDNSVLYYLSKKLKEQKKIKSIYLSSSDGAFPFWDKTLFKDVSYWGQGKTFNKKNEKILNIFFLKLKNFFYKKIVFNIIIFLFGYKVDQINQIILKLFYNKKFINILKKVDLVISSGGHHISSELDKNSICVQLTDMISTIVFNKKLVLWSQSIGEVDYNCKYVVRAIRRLIQDSKYIFPRDDNSINFIKKIKAYKSEKIFKCPDSVFGLQKKNINLKNKKKVALIAIYTAKKRSLVDENKYIDFFTKILNFLNKNKFKIILLPMQYKGLAGDERQTLQKISMLSDVKDVKIIDKDENPKNTINLFHRSSLIIAHKTHAIFYGLSLSIPTLAIYYHKKAKNVMESYDLKKFAVDDKNLNFKNTIQLIDELIKNQKNFKRKIFKKTLPIYKMVNENFLKIIKKIDNN